MRLVTLDSREAGGRPALCLSSGEILDLAASPSGLTAAQWRPQSVVSVLAEGEEGAARVGRLVAEFESAPEAQRQEWRRNGRLLPAAGTRLMPPIRRPGLLLMVTDAAGACYVKNPNAAVGPEVAVAPPVPGTALFLLPMLGAVVGRPLFRATEVQASRAVAALTLVADLGAARLAAGAGTSVGGGQADARQFPGACVIGPALVTLDEFAGGNGWPVALRVNGRDMATAAPARTLTDLTRSVAALSARYAFRPGDIVGLPVANGEYELPPGSAVVLSLQRGLELRFTIGS